jgi:hypothetical protein
LPEHHGTRFPGKQVAVELSVRVLACLAEGWGIRGTARVCEVDAQTVLQWLMEAAEPLQAFARSCLCEVPVRQVQRDAWYALRRAVTHGEVSEDEASQRLSRGEQGDAGEIATLE